MRTTSATASSRGRSGERVCARCAFTTYATTYASLLIAQGAHPKYIQAQLGHASIQTTLGHLMPQVHQAEARRLDRLVFGDQAIEPTRRLAAVRIGRPRRRCKMGAENTTGLAT